MWYHMNSRESWNEEEKQRNSKSFSRFDGIIAFGVGSLFRNLRFEDVKIEGGNSRRVLGCLENKVKERKWCVKQC